MPVALQSNRHSFLCGCRFISRLILPIFQEGQCLFHILWRVDTDCFLLGMEVFSATPESTYVFEDSFHGLQAGMTSGATVIGLATTNTRKAITGKAHYIIDDFAEMTYEKLLTMQR